MVKHVLYFLLRNPSVSIEDRLRQVVVSFVHPWVLELDISTYGHFRQGLAGYQFDAMDEVADDGDCSFWHDLRIHQLLFDLLADAVAAHWL